MADSKLSDLAALAAAPATDDELYIRDVSDPAATASKRITVANLVTGLATSTDLTTHAGVSAATTHGNLGHSNANDHANTLDHSNANDHASSHTHASHTGIGATDHHSNANDHAATTAITAAQHGALGPITGAHGHDDLDIVGANDHHVAFVQADHDGLPNPHHSNANDHAKLHTVTDTLAHTFPGGGTTYLRDDGTFQVVTATLPDMVVIRRSTNQAATTIAAGYAAVVPGNFTINTGHALTLAANASFRII